MAGRAAAKCSTENGPVEAHLEDAHLLALVHQLVHGLVGGLAAGAHEHDHPLGIGRAHVVEEVVGPADETGQAVHVVLDDARSRRGSSG